MAIILGDCKNYCAETLCVAGYMKDAITLATDMKLRIRLTRQPTPQSSPSLVASRSHKHSRHSRQMS